ncbi:MAG TPA: hypothetical protein VHH11_13840 [Gammaproteobacteria bacterium]|nr:hypothetical protein [Gammaproteobacteria bacterium]
MSADEARRALLDIRAILDSDSDIDATAKSPAKLPSLTETMIAPVDAIGRTNPSDVARLNAADGPVQRLRSVIERMEGVRHENSRQATAVANMIRHDVVWILAPVVHTEAASAARVGQTLVPIQRGARALGDEDLSNLFALMAESTPDSGLYWSGMIARFAPGAVLDAMAALADVSNTRELHGSTLAAVSDLVCQRLRRAILHRELRASGWNLSRCGERLRLGGSANVLRAIRDLELTSEYKAAKEAGLIRVGGRTKGERKSKLK